MSKTAADLLDTDTVWVIADDHRVGKLHTTADCHHLDSADEYYKRPADAYPGDPDSICGTCKPDPEQSVATARPPDSRSWAYPGCPACESDVFVQRNPNQYADYRCESCNEIFDEDEALSDADLAALRRERDPQIRVES